MKSLDEQIREGHLVGEEDLTDAGPFVAISREFGCGGFSLGLLLLDLLNDDAEEGKSWHIYHKEIIESLAAETGMTMDVLDRRRRQKPGVFSEMFRSLGGKRVPSGLEIRRRMAGIIRGIAMDGHAILVGQGSTLATTGIPHGLRVRLVAPLPWRVKQVAFREALSETQAKIHINEETERRLYLQKIYERKTARTSPFHLTFDCSVFKLSQIAVLVYRAMKFIKVG